jgi:hypothetical protein
MQFFLLSLWNNFPFFHWTDGRGMRDIPVYVALILLMSKTRLPHIFRISNGLCLAAHMYQQVL